MSTTDVPTLLAEALQREAAAMTVTDSQQAVRRLERTMRAHRQRRLVASLAAAAAAVGVLVAGSALVGRDDRAEVPPAETSGSPAAPTARPPDRLRRRQGPPGRRPGRHRGPGPGRTRAAVLARRASAGVTRQHGPCRRRGSPAGSAGPSPSTTGSCGRFGAGGPVLVAGRLPGRLRRAPRQRLPRGLHVVVDVATGKAEKLRDFAGPYRPMDWTPDGSSLRPGLRPVDDRAGGWSSTRSTCRPAARPSSRRRGDARGPLLARRQPDRLLQRLAGLHLRGGADGTEIRVVLTFGPGLSRTARASPGPRTAPRWSGTSASSGQVNLLDVATGVERAAHRRRPRPGIDWDRP